MTAVAVSRLWAGKPVGNGVRVTFEISVASGKYVGVGVQVVMTTISAAVVEAAVAVGAGWFDREKTVDNKTNKKITKSTPQTPRNIFALRFCLENQIGNCLMVFMFLPFHLKLKMRINKIMFYDSILLLI